MSESYFTLYNSSAGSGKTTTLVKEYLALCLPYPRKFNRIIGITFTNKATAEMKERILRDLQNLILYKDRESNELTQEIVRFLLEKTTLTKEQIPGSAKELLERILHQYSDFAFSTIDSFVMRIVRSFAYELNLALNFEIELDKDEIIKQAIQAMMLQISKDEKLKRILVKFTLSKMNDDKSWNIDNEIAGLAGLLFESANYQHITDFQDVKIEDYEKAILQIQKKIKDFEKTLKEKAGVIRNEIKAQGATDKAFSYSDFPKYLDKLINLDYKYLAPNNRLVKNLGDDKWYAKSADTHSKGIIDENKAHWKQLFDEIQEYLSEALPKNKALHLIQGKIYPLAVLTELKHLIQNYSSENNIIHISESNRRIASIVEQESVPFIYERVGQRYEHYLIDEFQDTSRLQWNNLMPLIENSLAAGNFNMLVGDAKQSIYRWRDGDVEQFVSLQNKESHYAEGISLEREKYIKQHLHLQNLKENHRSTKAITTFNNTFFQYYTSLGECSEKIKHVYHEHQQIIPSHKQKTNGFVNVHFFGKEEEKEDQHIAYLTEKIETLIEKGHFQPKDICILGRQHKELAKYAAALSEKNIEVVSSDVAELKSSEKISFLISFLRWLQSGDSQASFLHVLNYAIEHKHILGGELYEKAVSFAFGKFYSADKAYSLFEKMLLENDIKIEISTLKHLSVYEICEILISAFYLEETPDIFLQFFMDSIITRSRRTKGHMSDFLIWWDEKGFKEKVKIPEDLNAVKLFTVHSAKGLQFPVVFYCLANKSKRSKGASQWVTPPEEIDTLSKAIVEPNSLYQDSIYQDIFDEEKEKEDLDSLNTTYVAFTRPTEQFYLIANESHDYSKHLKDYVLQSGDFEEKQEHSWSSGVYEFKAQSPKEDLKQEEKRVIHQNWQEAVNLHFAPEHALYEDARQAGNQLHTILSWIDHADDVQEAFQKAITYKIIEEKDATTLKEQILHIINHPELSPYFQKEQKIYNEKTLFYKGEILRPDRLIETKDTMYVIDYKLIDFQTISDDSLANYQLQIQGYCKALSEIQKKPTVGYLAFLKGEIKLLEI